MILYVNACVRTESNMFGIKETELICAEYLDIEGNDVEEILSKVISNINS